MRACTNLLALASPCAIQQWAGAYGGFQENGAGSFHGNNFHGMPQGGQRNGGNHHNHAQQPREGQTSQIVPVPGEYVGAIIGKAGSKINEIRCVWTASTLHLIVCLMNLCVPFAVSCSFCALGYFGELFFFALLLTSNYALSIQPGPSLRVFRLTYRVYMPDATHVSTLTGLPPTPPPNTVAFCCRQLSGTQIRVQDNVPNGNPNERHIVITGSAEGCQHASYLISARVQEEMTRRASQQQMAA